MDQEKVLREYEVVEKTGLSSSTIRRLEAKGEFPKRIKISERVVGWLFSDISKWLEGRGASWNQ